MSCLPGFVNRSCSSLLIAVTVAQIVRTVRGYVIVFHIRCTGRTSASVRRRNGYDLNIVLRRATRAGYIVSPYIALITGAYGEHYKEVLEMIERFSAFFWQNKSTYGLRKCLIFGEPCRNRTDNLMIKSHLLCQLS